MRDEDEAVAFLFQLAQGAEEALDLIQVEYEVLAALSEAPQRRLRMTDLAATLHLSPSGLTRAVDRLESAGLVQRETAERYRRLSP